MPKYLDSDGDPHVVAFGSLVMLKGRPCKVTYLDSVSKRNKCTISGVDVLTGDKHEVMVAASAKLPSFEVTEVEYEVDTVVEEDGEVKIHALSDDDEHDFTLPLEVEVAAELLEAFESNEEGSGEKFFIITAKSAPVGKGKDMTTEEVVVSFKEGSDEEPEAKTEAKTDAKTDAKTKTSTPKAMTKEIGDAIVAKIGEAPISNACPIVGVIGVECWGHCLTFLPADSLKRWGLLSRVCRQWFASRREEVWYSDLTLTLPHLTDKTAKKLALLSRGRRKGEKEAPHNGGIKNLNIEKCRELGNKGMRALCSGLSNLVHLNLRECGNVTDNGFKAIASLTRLQSLNISGNNLTEEDTLACLSGFTELRHLNLSEVKVVGETTLRRITRLPLLEELYLISCNVNDQGASILASATELKTLDVSFCAKLTDTATSDLAKLTKLQTLNLAWCSGLTDGAVETLANGMPNLTALNLSVCPGLTNRSMNALSRLTKLRKLEIIGCRSVNDEGLNALTTLADLRSINVSGTNVTPAAGDALQATMPQLSSFIIIDN